MLDIFRRKLHWFETAIGYLKFSRTAKRRPRIPQALLRELFRDGRQNAALLKAALESAWSYGQASMILVRESDPFSAGAPIRLLSREELAAIDAESGKDPLTRGISNRETFDSPSVEPKKDESP